MDYGALERRLREAGDIEAADAIAAVQEEREAMKHECNAEIFEERRGKLIEREANAVLRKDRDDRIEDRSQLIHRAEAAEAERDKLKAELAEHEGHNQPCHYCGKLCSTFAGDPSEWPVPLSHDDQPGFVRWHHAGCVSARLAALAEAVEVVRLLLEGEYVTASGMSGCVTAVHLANTQRTRARAFLDQHTSSGDPVQGPSVADDLPYEGADRSRLSKLIRRAAAAYDAMSPEQKAAHDEAQRQSWIRSMAPCEHGVRDWETCPDCLAKHQGSSNADRT